MNISHHVHGQGTSHQRRRRRRSIDQRQRQQRCRRSLLMALAPRPLRSCRTVLLCGTLLVHYWQWSCCVREVPQLSGSRGGSCVASSASSIQGALPHSSAFSEPYSANVSPTIAHRGIRIEFHKQYYPYVVCDFYPKNNRLRTLLAEQEKCTCPEFLVREKDVQKIIYIAFFISHRQPVRHFHFINY